MSATRPPRRKPKREAARLRRRDGFGRRWRKTPRHERAATVRVRLLELARAAMVEAQRGGERWAEERGR